MVKDISLHSTKDLVNELMERFDHIVVNGVKILDTRHTNSINIRKYKGNHIVCSGLCNQLSSIINEDYEESLSYINGAEHDFT
jgi:hypothetical protein